jgi:hypothetical protein
MLAFPPAAHAGSTFVVRQNPDGTVSLRAVYEVLVLMCVSGFVQINGQHVQRTGTQVADPASPQNLPPQVPCSQVRDVAAVGSTDGADTFSLVMLGFAALAGMDISEGSLAESVLIDGRGAELQRVRASVGPPLVEGQSASIHVEVRGRFSRQSRVPTALGQVPGTTLPRLTVRLGNNGATLDASAYPSPVIAFGGSGRDRLVGGRAADTLNGGAGADALVGGPGNDVFVGGPGRDTANGGPGRDRARGVEVRRGIP